MLMPPGKNSPRYGVHAAGLILTQCKSSWLHWLYYVDLHSLPFAFQRCSLAIECLE